jgi:hypothetical protein
MDVPADSTAQLLRAALLYGLYPLWLLAGLGDWWVHRVERIELTAGLRETLLHCLMLLELGAGIGAVVLLEINSAVIVLAALACLGHELTVWRDLIYAQSRRRIRVVEQWVHSLQLVFPWVGLAALVLLYPDAALGVIGRGEAADWTLRWKNPPMPLPQIALVGVGGLLFVVLPFIDELVRALRADGAVRASAIRRAPGLPQTRHRR